MAIARLKEAGATIEKVNFRIQEFPVDAQVSGSNGRPFLVLARGTPDEQDRSALRRTDTVEKAGFMAMQLARRQALPIISHHVGSSETVDKSGPLPCGAL